MDNFILKITWAGLECNVKQILEIEIFTMNIKFSGKKYSPFVLKMDEGNCRISPSLRIIINDSVQFFNIYYYLKLRSS